MKTIGCAMLLVASLTWLGCSPPIPGDIANYETECILMTPEPHGPTEDDPHQGFKNVYACGISLDDLLAGTNEGVLWPEGSWVLKESTKEHQDFPWLIATASKSGGAWEWAEYTRNFESEEFLQIPVGEDVCIDCHKKVESSDFIYTRYLPPAP